MEQLVLLLIIGAISLINWLIEQSGKRREQRRFEQERARRQEAEPTPYLAAPSPAPVQELPEPAPQQEMRKFLEAFGIPLPEEPPAPVTLQEVEAPAPRQIPEPEPAQPVLVPKRKVTPTKTHQPVAIIKSPATLRQAIIWREILGPPRSLQSY